MGILGQAVRDRLKGDRPSPPRALLAAAVASLAAGVLTYRTLRA